MNYENPEMIARIVLILVGVSLLIVAAFCYLVRESDKVFVGLFKLEDCAENAITKEQLMQVKKDLEDYRKKHCWHWNHYHSERVRKISIYIQGRLKGVAA